MPPLEAGLEDAGLIRHFGVVAIAGVVTPEARGCGLALYDVLMLEPTVVAVGEERSLGAGGGDVPLLLMPTPMSFSIHLFSDQILAVILARRHLARHRTVLEQLDHAGKVIPQLRNPRLFAAVLFVFATGKAHG
jgi:hypothetical protein